ncbi:MAG: urea ABC transporter [Candidatus Rokuibacteriota bacterium]|nr:MAG: urea ABC transporter [Candidatus Rokubacteria bacterium]
MRADRRRFLKAAGATLGAVSLAPAIVGDALAQANVIKVAAIHDLSGGLDIYGRPMVDCLNYAVEEINGAGGLLGRQIRLISYDAQSNIQLYTQFATEAATKERVAVVHAGITSASREAIRPVLKRFNTLYFYNTQYEGGVCDRNCFCTGSTPAQNVDKLVPFTLKKFGKKVYTVAADYNYGHITAKWVKKFTQDHGGEVLQTDFFPLEVADFGPAITKIQAAKPDFVMSALVGGNHISFYRQWAASGMNRTTPVASTTFGNGLEHQVTTPEEHRGYIGSQSYYQELTTEANQAFLKKFLPKYGATSKYVTPLAIQSYHGLHLWAAAVKKANSIDRMKVIEALESNLSFSGPAGKTAIDPKTHHCSLDVYIAEAQNRAFKVLESYPQQPPADTAAVCDLKKNPNENQQYVIDVKT